MRLASTLLPLVLAVALTGAAGSGVASAGGPSPSTATCAVSPDPVTVGADFTISGTGYAPNEALTLVIAGANGTSFVWTYANAQGQLSRVWRVSYAGPHTISVHDSITDAVLASCAFTAVQPQDDGDGIPATSDNCPTVYNPGQENSDANFVDQTPPEAFDDLTWVRSDTAGDACDADDDNDGLADAVETAGPPCASATAATDPRKRDTDGDRRLDKAECDLGTNPVGAASAPSVGVIGPDADGDLAPDAFDPNDADSDSDGDGVLDGVEFRYYASDMQSRNSDGDICDDAREIASVNADTAVTSADLQQVAQAFGAAGGPAYRPYFDMNKDGSITAADLSFVAQRFGPC